MNGLSKLNSSTAENALYKFMHTVHIHAYHLPTGVYNLPEVGSTQIYIYVH